MIDEILCTVHTRVLALVLDSRVGSYFEESWNFNFYMVSSCSILFTDFGTVFVFVQDNFYVVFAF